MKAIHKILIAVAAGIVAATTAAFAWNLIYKNSRLSETASFSIFPLSKMNYNDVEDLINSKINPMINKTRLDVIFEESKFHIYPKDLKANFDSNEIFKYAKKSQNGKKQPQPKLKYDKNILTKILEYFADQTKIEPKKFSYKKGPKGEIEVTAGCNGKKINIDRTSKKICSILESENFLEKIKEDSLEPIEAEYDIIKDPESEIDLEKIKKEVDTPVKDAKLTIKDGKRQYEEEAIGIDVDLNDAKRTVKNTKKGSYKIAPNIIKPKETKQTLQKKADNQPTPNELSSFTTSFSKGEKNRNHNIKLAAQAINRTLLPGEEFSFGATAGKQSGYKEATIYENGKKKKGLGGGICQVSTTLFNAAAKAGLKITSRQAHSRPVFYVAPGKDATFDSGGTDFKFKNTLNNPIKIVASATDSSTTVKILGTNEGVKGELSSHKTVDAPGHIEAVSTLKVTKNGQIINTQNFKSVYKAVDDKGRPVTIKTPGTVGIPSETENQPSPAAQPAPPQPAAPPAQPPAPTPNNQPAPAVQPAQPQQPAAPPAKPSQPQQPAAPPEKPSQPQQPAAPPAAEQPPKPNTQPSLQTIKENLSKGFIKAF